MMEGLMLKCKICGREFDPIGTGLTKHYVARDNTRSGLVVAVSSDEPRLFDAFDCPYCGCQFVAQERKRAFVPVMGAYVGSDDESEEEN